MGACLNFVGSKFKDVGDLCECICEVTEDNECKRDRCVKRCKKAKAAKNLFDKYKKLNQKLK